MTLFTKSSLIWWNDIRLFQNTSFWSLDLFLNNICFDECDKKSPFSYRTIFEKVASHLFGFQQLQMRFLHSCSLFFLHFLPLLGFSFVIMLPNTAFWPTSTNFIQVSHPNMKYNQKTYISKPPKPQKSKLKFVSQNYIPTVTLLLFPLFTPQRRGMGLN